MTLMDVDFVPKYVISSDLISKELIEPLEYFRLLEYFNVCYLSFIEIKASIDKTVRINNCHLSHTV